MLLMIDNYDSFTYNLVQYFGELGQEVEVHRNDEISLQEIEKLAPEFLVISPGPCTPNEAGISIEAIKHFSNKVPILGVCLGFQAMVQAYGGKIIGAKKIMHGKVSAVHHTGKGVFSNLKNPLNATRYHSLVADQSSLPDCFEITSWTNDDNGNVDEIMGIKHKEFAIEGVQFHPESILTEQGHEMLGNFLHQK
ncbi:MAG: aminodeoxychorismate/anthranilate synthase component II [Candidatus Thioglobus sp.]|jgi:anthranilate synthase component 2|uniref:anthranilate synthase component II n=1 Tax=Candidatus Thioglobus sp. TaxID=2026721 RepID=UPI0001BD379E|nr:aminodeoxychorismate/anthranilate synthase component II [Candidatus Thioglobus sp.]EEZ80059.1 MAG: anthranilate/para-aminobenzoate synthase component II [uncultured Candidatus Thioglobus sp.]MBT3186651.1 aminodeoxychorismate/anthranilate synthase component II [Candidatus Thioglobus sp.]MBT3432245.1 aminodeoxychorismate/anthranilate synthase component II [Candidatus Thioglobus sp.]MBT4553434.1 aminodeoxychorismate/anthranilate synthase component II [Candidatus Thioglobus sp.]MBT6326958.1 ami